MDRTYKKGIYNYCIKKWDELKEKDEGYFPSKHDDVVFEDAAKHFNLTEDEVNKIFSEVSKEIADKNVKGLTQEEKLQQLKQIVRDNAENPWATK